MKNKVFSTVLLLGGIIMAAVLTSAITVKQNDPLKQQQEDYYTCPMHTEVVSDKPGTCPICGMKLVLTSSLGSTKMMQTTDTVHVMQGNHMTGDSLHMMQGHMHDSASHVSGATMMGTMHEMHKVMPHSTMEDSTMMHGGKVPGQAGRK